MRLSIFARFITSYLILFCIFTGVSQYFTYRLVEFNEVIRSIIFDDKFILEHSMVLTDAFLSESRNERKYFVLKDESLFESALKLGNEFNELLSEAITKTKSDQIKQLFLTISLEHLRFMQLVNTERELIKIAQPYAPKWYTEEKKKAAENIIDLLKTIRQINERNTFNKIIELNERIEKTKNISIVFSLFAVSIGLFVAFFITRSIKKPLDLIRGKTVEISQGNFKGDVEVTSPPEIVELAAALNIMCHKLQEVDDLKLNFFSHVSHELRTPLTSIKVGTEMLLEGLGGQPTKKQQHILSIVARESNRLIELVNALLDLSKMEAGMLKYQCTPTLLPKLVEKTLERLAPLVEEKKLIIENRIQLLNLVLVDQDRILLVLQNIIGNAIKFSHRNGTIKLEAYLKENVVEVAVHDTGPGIAREDLERIFHKFQQVVSTKEPYMKGTGLGLATVKQVILAHGGKVWATSQIGTGTTLHITLPLAA